MSNVLDPYTRGDGFQSQRFECVFRDDNGDITTAPGTATAALLQFREKNAHGALIAEFKNSDSTLVITDATNWIFTTVERVLTTTYPPTTSTNGSTQLQTKAVWDLQITHNGSDSPTTVASGTMIIYADVSRAS